MPGPGPRPATGAAIEVDVEEARALLAHGALLVDVREAWELEQARIATDEALHIPLMELPRRVAEIPADRTVLVFCHSGNRSGHAARFLTQAGYPDAMNVRGGLVAWQRNGFPIRTG